MLGAIVRSSPCDSIGIAVSDEGEFVDEIVAPSSWAVAAVEGSANLQGAANSLIMNTSRRGSGS